MNIIINQSFPIKGNSAYTVLLAKSLAEFLEVPK